VLKVGMPISTRITAFIPYVSENDVSPLLDLIIELDFIGTLREGSGYVNPLFIKWPWRCDGCQLLLWVPWHGAMNLAAAALPYQFPSFACSGPTHRNHGLRKDLLYSILFVTAYLLALRRMALAFFFSSGRISSVRCAKLVDAILLSAFAFMFSYLGTCLMENSLKVLARFLTFSKYLIMPGYFATLAIKASYSASLLVASNLNLIAYVNSVPSGLVSIRPASEPSTHDEPSVNNIQGSGSSSLFSMGISVDSSSGRSTMKSAKICPLTDVLGL
ncbi:hypothetical protein Tco_0025303, partial [Tanacetum coccineum]